MKATYLPPLRTPVSPIDASRAYRASLFALVGRAPIPQAVAVMHAHGALETGNFHSCWHYGVGNIKAGEEYLGLYTAIYGVNEYEMRGGVRTLVWYDPPGELLHKGGPVRPGTESAVPPGHRQTRFRAYESLAGGVTDKIRFLMKPDWRAALEIALTGNADGYVRAIHARHYFTANLEPYVRGVVALARQLLPIALETADEPEAPSDETCSDMAHCMRVPLPDWLLSRVVMFNKIGPSLDDYWADTRRLRLHDSDPTMPEVKLPDDRDTEPPGAA